MRSLILLNVLLVLLIEWSDYPIPFGLKPPGDRYRIGRMYLTATGAAHDGRIGGVPEERQCFPGRQCFIPESIPQFYPGLRRRLQFMGLYRRYLLGSEYAP